MMEQSADSKAMQKELEAMRHQINSEVGTEPPCPWCAKPRVTRTTYIRCNPHGTNWFRGDDIFSDPRTRATRPLSPEPDTGALPVS